MAIRCPPLLVAWQGAITRAAVAGFFAVLAAGCVARGPVESPVVRNVTWFSYLAGDDVRAACAPGAPNRYRFVLNAVWGEQTRTYDVVERPGGGVQISRVFGQANLIEVNPFDPEGPWRGQRSGVALDAAAMARIGRLLPGEEAAAPGTWLRSDDYYWTAAACEDGRFIFQAWDSDTPDFDGLPFLKVLLPADRTGVPPRPWRRLALPPFAAGTPEAYGSGASRQRFQLEVGKNGLRTGPALF